MLSLDDHAIVDGAGDPKSLADLKVGDPVAVEWTRQADGTLLATAIVRLWPGGTRAPCSTASTGRCRSGAAMPMPHVLARYHLRSCSLRVWATSSGGSTGSAGKSTAQEIHGAGVSWGGFPSPEPRPATKRLICRLGPGANRRPMINTLLRLLRLFPYLCGGHRHLALENVALHHQLAAYTRTLSRPMLRSSDRLQCSRKRRRCQRRTVSRATATRTARHPVHMLDRQAGALVAIAQEVARRGGVRDGLHDRLGRPVRARVLDHVEGDDGPAMVGAHGSWRSAAE